jgi:HK97 family phage portal protein
MENSTLVGPNGRPLEARSTLANPSNALFEAFTGGQPTASNIRVNEQTALSISAFYAAVTAISSDIASFPRLLIEENPKDGTFKRHTDTANIESLLNFAPNSESTGATFWQSYLVHAVVWGNAYAEIIRDKSEKVVEFWLLDPESVQMVRSDSGQLGFKVYFQGRTGSMSKVLDPRDVLYMPGVSFNGIEGARWVKIAKESLGVGVAAQEFNGAYIGNSATPAGSIEVPGELSPEAFNRLRKSFANRHEGSSNAGRTIVLEDGATWHQLGSDPEKAQLSETRLFTIEEVARWLRFPLSKLQHLVNSANHNSLEQLDKEYVSDTLTPWMQRFQQVCKQKIFNTLPKEGRDFRIKHDTRARQQGDSSQVSEIQREQVNIGALTPNEVRKLNGLNPIDGDPGGEQSWMQSAMAPTSAILRKWDLEAENQALANEKLRLEIEGMKAAAMEPEPEPTVDPEEPTDDQEDPEDPTSDDEIAASPEETPTDDATRALIQQVLAEVGFSAVERDYEMLDGLEDAQTPMFEMTFQRLLAVEHDKVTRKAKSGDLHDWYEGFYSSHSKYVKTAISTPIETFCRSYWSCTKTDVSATEADAFVSKFAFDIVKQHIATSANDIRSNVDVDYWKAERHKETAATVLQQLRAALDAHEPQKEAPQAINVTVNVPERSVNIENQIDTPDVFVESPKAPEVNVTVERSDVHVAAPEVTVTPEITIEASSAEVSEKDIEFLRELNNE